MSIYRKLTVACTIFLSAVVFAGKGSIFDETTDHTDITSPIDRVSDPLVIPTEADQAASLKLIREMYELPIGNGNISQIQPLSAKMAADAMKLKDDPSGRYVLLNQARELSLAAGDVAGAFRVSKLLCVNYRVNTAELEADSLKKLGAMKLSDSAKSLAIDWGLEAVERAADESDSTSVLEIVQSLQALSSTIKDQALHNKIKEQTQGATVRLTAASNAKMARTALQENPDNKSAARELGTYLCFVKGNWDEGLPLLAKGDDATLASIAMTDIEKIGKPEEQIDKGNAWWNYAKTADRLRKSAAIARAEYWYSNALPKVTGLNKVFTEKRLAEVEAIDVDRFATHEVYSVVFVCDATGTMLGLKFELLKQELAKAIDNLPANARFNVIFFKGGTTDDDWMAPLSEKMLEATPAERAKMLQLVNRMSVLGNGTNPIPALKLALEFHPSRLVFLTDGEFNNYAEYEEVLATVSKGNASHRTWIDTILMMGEDPKSEEQLVKMAADGGGKYRKVLENDLR